MNINFKYDSDIKDLLDELSSEFVNKLSDNNTCKRIYHEVLLDNSIGQVWECADE